MPSTKGTARQGAKERILVNRYKVQRKLGSGSFGTVFVVEDLKSDEKWLVARLKAPYLFSFVSMFKFFISCWMNIVFGLDYWNFLCLY